MGKAQGVPFDPYYVIMLAGKKSWDDDHLSVEL
jgi:hypothetical protein